MGIFQQKKAGLLDWLILTCQSKYYKKQECNTRNIGYLCVNVHKNGACYNASIDHTPRFQENAISSIN